MLSIKNTRTLDNDDKYFTALEVEDDVVWPLNRAGYEIYDAVAQARGVDNAEQKEYIENQINEMIYQLNQIKDKLEG